MANDNPPPHRDLLPVPGAGVPPQYAVGTPTPQGLGPVLRGQEPDDFDDDGIDLREIWRMLVKHKWLLLSIAVVGFLGAMLYSFVQTPIYQSSTTLQVDKRAASVVKFGQEAEAVQDMDDRTGLGTQLELLKSRALAERVIDELRLDRSGPSTEALLAAADGTTTEEAPQGTEAATGLFGKIQDSWRKMREPAAVTEQKLSREGVVGAFRQTVSVEQIRNSRLLKVTVENPDPQLASRIANTMAQSFITLNLERRLESSSYAKSFLEEQLVLIKAKLEESERKLNQFTRARNILTLDEKTNVVNQTYSEFSSALAKAEQDRIKIESEYQSIASSPDTARQVLDSSAYKELKTQKTKLDAEYQLNRKVYKDDFPKMQQLRAQIAEIDAKIKAEVDTILRSVSVQLETAKRQEASIRARLAQTRAEIVTGQDQSVDFNLLKREVDTNRELYNGLLQQVKEVGVAGGVETNNIQVVDKAEVPLFPFKPNIMRNSMMGLLIGLVLGCLVVFLMESLDDSIKVADEVEKTLMVPLLGVIPKIKEKTDLASVALLAHEDPRGHLAEAYRSLRTSLQFSTSEGAPKRLVVTSTTKNEGKSTTALALAINFAQLGNRVAMIDADMRNPTLHKFLGLDNAQGLSNHLSGHAEEGALVKDTTIANLSAITAGPVPPSPVDLLTGPKFGELLDHLQAQGFEYIIIDGPPVLGLADAVVLGNQVPSVLYVTQASHTRKSHIKDAFRRLRMAGIVPRGVVLTKATAQNTAYYTYDSYYGYGADTGKGSKRRSATGQQA